MGLRRFLLGLLVLTVLGCTKRTTLPSPQSNAISPSVAPIAAAPLDERSNAAATPSETQDGARDALPAKANPSDAAVEEAVPAPHVERFLLLAQGGPIVVEAFLTIDGRPLREAMARLVETLLADADTDGDGRPTWSEIVESAAFKSGRYGNVEANTETESARLVQLYDVNRNGVADREEVPRFLTRNAGGARPFALTSSNEYRGYNQFDSPTLRLLDQNRDGLLDDGEIAAAAIRLRSRDADTDDILLAADLASTSLETASGQMSNLRRAAPDSAYLLDGQTQWDALLFSLSELYAYGGDLDTGSFPHRPGLFHRLDADGDGVVRRDELPSLATVAPHIQLAVDFGQTPGAIDPPPDGPVELPPESRGGPRLRIVSFAEELEFAPGSLAESAARIALRLPDSSLVFFANDGAGADYAAQSQMQISQYDGNRDGYLEEREIPDGLPGIAATFAALDANGDGKLYPEELADYLRGRAGAALSQIRARAADHSDAVFAALDEDNDGRLETRELDRAAETLRRLDANGDGRVASNELPGALVVGFVRGDPQQSEALFVLPVAPPPQREAPAWFRHMDFNGDGEIAAREFLGDPDRFDALDTNGDGYLSLDEATAGAAGP